MKEKEIAYVFGCGQCFKNKESDIIEKYDIAAILDNKKEGEIKLLNGSLVPVLKPAEAINKTSIPIIIMVCDFYSIWQELKALSIDSSRIIFPDVFLPYTEEEQVYHVNGGGFQILAGETYYINKNRQYLIESTETLKNLCKKLERDLIDASFITDIAPFKPLNRTFGFSRGTPIDRFYIEKWLCDNQDLIKGDVLEIAEDTYTKQFGKSDAISHILHVNMEKEGFIKGDLETGEGILENSMDCIILTQTLPFIYNCKNVMSNLYKMLRAGGYALITTGGISQISRYDMDRWGHFWSFTTASLKKLLEESDFEKNYNITVFGNVKTACALLYGIAAEELTEEELVYVDEDYPVSICAVVTKQK